MLLEFFKHPFLVWDKWNNDINATLENVENHLRNIVQNPDDNDKNKDIVERIRYLFYSRRKSFLLYEISYCFHRCMKYLAVLLVFLSALFFVGTLFLDRYNAHVTGETIHYILQNNPQMQLEGVSLDPYETRNNILELKLNQLNQQLAESAVREQSSGGIFFLFWSAAFIAVYFFTACIIFSDAYDRYRRAQMNVRIIRAFMASRKGLLEEKWHLQWMPAFMHTENITDAKE